MRDMYSWLEGVWPLARLVRAITLTSAPAPAPAPSPDGDGDEAVFNNVGSSNLVSKKWPI